MKDLIEPKKSWKIPQTHFINAINDEWYRKLVEIENLISKYTNLFYIEQCICLLQRVQYQVLWG